MKQKEKDETKTKTKPKPKQSFTIKLRTNQQKKQSTKLGNGQQLDYNKMICDLGETKQKKQSKSVGNKHKTDILRMCNRQQLHFITEISDGLTRDNVPEYNDDIDEGKNERENKRKNDNDNDKESKAENQPIFISTFNEKNTERFQSK